MQTSYSDVTIGIVILRREKGQAQTPSYKARYDTSTVEVNRVPFLLYEVNAGHYRQKEEIRLSGKNSPFRRAQSDAGTRYWHAPDDFLLYLLGVERPADHRILIDLKPSDVGRVSLYRLRDAWGYSYETFTPLALRLESLFVDVEHEAPLAFKKQFSGPMETRDYLYEFLYLNGGCKGGKWTWGLVGRVNGALLWPDALRYFAASINQQLVQDGDHPLCS